MTFPPTLTTIGSCNVPFGTGVGVPPGERVKLFEAPAVPVATISSPVVVLPLHSNFVLSLSTSRQFGATRIGTLLFTKTVPTAICRVLIGTPETCLRESTWEHPVIAVATPAITATAAATWRALTSVAFVRSRRFALGS